MSETPTIGEMTLAAYSDALAAKQPVPGGGAASAVVLAQAAALGSMVIAYTKGKKAYAAHEDRLSRLADVLTAAREEALLLADRDAAAYLALNALWKLGPEERIKSPGFAAALDEAIAAPQTIADLALATLAALRSLDGATTSMLRSDLVIASRLAHAALEGGLLNVEANLPSLTDLARTTALRELVKSRRAEATSLVIGAAARA